MYRYGVLCGLAFGIVAGCSGDDDDDSAPPVSPAAGAGGAADSGASGAPGAVGGMSADLGGAGGVVSAPELGGAGAAPELGGAGAAPELGGAAPVTVAGGAGGVGEGGAGGEAGSGPTDPLATSTVIDLNDVKAHPFAYDWFDFKPNVGKLILAGAPETQHIALLWYTVVNGAVGLHYHAKTESVYVISGTQTDAKGTYTSGTAYFNPPTSGHQISDSSGFFLLAYAAPPDFANTDLIQPYSPVVIDTADPNLTTTYSFTSQGAGIQTFAVPLDQAGGLFATLIETTASEAYAYQGNYLLVLKGSCDVYGRTLGPNMLVVAKTTVPQAYQITATTASTCLAMGVSF